MAVSRRAKAKVVWIGASALGAILGSILAVDVFPSAGFGRNPTGLYGPNVFGFAFLISAPLAIVQWLALRWILPSLDVVARRAWIWVPVSLLGWMATALPLWSVPAEVLVFVPVYWIVPLLPGSVVLGLMQWSYWARYYTVNWAWIALTVAGAFVGAFLVPVAMILGFYLQSSGAFWFPDFEILCALMIVMGVSALQAIAMVNIRPKPGGLAIGSDA